MTREAILDAYSESERKHFGLIGPSDLRPTVRRRRPGRPLRWAGPVRSAAGSRAVDATAASTEPPLEPAFGGSVVIGKN
jgi:hypothetical protein